MNETITTDESDAIFADARLCRDDLAGDFDGTIVPERVWFALLAKRVWPVKADAAIMQYAGCPDRTARAYTSGDRIPSATVLRDLLLGDEGDAVWRELARLRAPAWFRRDEELRDLGRRAAAFIAANIQGAGYVASMQNGGGSPRTLQGGQSTG